MVEIEPPPEGCTHCHDTLLTPGAVAFVTSLVEAFSSQVDDVRCIMVKYVQTHFVALRCIV